MKREHWILAAAALLTAVLMWWTGTGQQNDTPTADPARPVDQRRPALADDVNAKAPKITANINDLTAPLSTILQDLPGAASVQACVMRPNARKRIVHFLDWNYVDKDLLAKVDGRKDWDAFLLEVDATQLDQIAALECLVTYHGLKRVLIEGLTEADMPALPDKVAQLRDAEEHKKALRAKLSEARAQVQWSKQGTERYKKAMDLERQIAGMMAHHREEMLKMGAAIRLLVAGHLEAVLPLDDAKLLDAAGPMPDGRQDPLAIGQRERAMVKNALAASPVAVIICGGSHNLMAEIRRQDPEADYYRVAVRGFVEATKGSQAGGK
jgi:hypothetical protein